MNIKDINPDAYRVVDQPLNINNLPQGSYSTVSQPEAPKQSFLQKAGSVLDMIFGGGKVGEAIGTEIAKAMASPEERKQPALTEGAPTAGEIVGSALQSAALFTPIGRVAGMIGKGLGKVGITTGAKFLSNVGAGAVAGEAFDVAGNLQEGKTGVEALKPGFGTAVGAGLPLVPPILKGARVLARESVGISTGAGGGAITELFKASAKGGEAKKAAVAALRGNTTPEQIVQEARGALGQIKNSRATEYVRSLNTLKESTKSYDISPIVDSVKTNLQKFGVTISQDGALDFSRSPIRFNTEAQKDITTIIETMADFGSRKGDRTVVGIDSLKRAFDDLYTPSGQARAFVQSVKDSARKILSEVPGYDAMSLNYETKSKLINEVQKALSLGDKASIDTSFKKLTTILRTNNEERKILAEELNAISGGTLIPTIAGQQMSEILPRGIARQIEGFGALGSILAGFGAPLLKMALFASPRVVGEFVNAIGIGAQAGNKLLDILGVKGVKLISPGDRILKAIQGKPAIASNTQTVKSATKVNTTKSIAVNPTTIPPELQSLAREAQKYSSAEEFVKTFEVDSLVREAKNLNISLESDAFLVGSTARQLQGTLRKDRIPHDFDILVRGITEEQASELSGRLLGEKIHVIAGEPRIGLKPIPLGKIQNLTKSQLTDFYNKVKGIKK